MNICFLSGIASKELPKDMREAISEVDILFVPIGGGLPSAEAYALAVSLEPRVIIPMLVGSDKAELKTFLKEGGAEGLKSTEKLTLKKKDLLDKAGEIALLAV